jgi:D-methionine transport system substrate-binding protein
MKQNIKRRQLIGASVILAASMLTSGIVNAADNGKLQTIRVGTMSGPDADIWKVVAKQARTEGLDIKVTEFNDYIQPNAALDAGDLDANGFQHQPFLDSQIRQRGYKIVSIGLTYTAPLGFYSKKIKSLKDLPENASVGIQNDPSNGNRALLLLQANHVLTLKAGAGVDGKNATPLDVIDNPKHIKLVELDAAQLPRSLDDLSAASINTDYAVKAGLSPAKDTIAREDVRGPYANLVAVRIQDRDKPWAKKLINAYHTPQVRDFINQRFNGSIIPAF